MSGFTIFSESPGKLWFAGRADAAWGGFYASPAKNEVAMMMPGRDGFAFENGLLMDALVQLAERPRAIFDGEEAGDLAYPVRSH
jgi:hypothetical protein